MKACFHLLLLAVICVCLSAAQQSDPIPGSLANSTSSQDTQDSSVSLADQARKLRKDHSEEVQMTEADASKLFAAVDRITKFASEDTGFPLHSPVKRRMINPDELEQSARENLSKKDYADRFGRSELTMKKFGLLPRDFDLKEFLVRAQRKDIAAYYDDDTKTISMLNTIPVEQQEAILAHELTHALQDQNYDLRNWLREAGGTDENDATRRAVVEGQATIVFIDYLLARVGRSVENTPGIVYRMEDPAVKYAVDSQLMHDAPMILREWGTFPYREGLMFENELLQSGGKKLAFSEVFTHPPTSTHDIIQPKAYLEGQNVAPLLVPSVKSILGDGYEEYDSGSMGELDVRALLWQLGTRTLADDLSKSWRGGSYIAVRPKSNAPANVPQLKLLYVSRWSTAEAARRFARFYANGTLRRYQSASFDGNLGCSTSDCPISSVLVTTEEGPVMVDLWKDNTVLVSESFDQDTAAKLISATRDMEQKSAVLAPAQPELGVRFYDEPAFRALQQNAGEEILDRLILKNSGN